MSAAIALWNIVREAQDLLVIGIIPLHGHIDANHRALVRQTLTSGLEYRGMQYRFIFINVFNKAACASFKRKIFFFTCALIR